MVKLQYARRIKKLSEHNISEVVWPFQNCSRKMHETIDVRFNPREQNGEVFPLFLSIVTFVSHLCVCVSRKESLRL